MNRILLCTFLIALALPAFAQDAGKQGTSDTAQSPASPPQAPADCSAKKFYPTLAVRLGHEGVTTLGFTINADGTVSDVHVVESSGHTELDQDAVEGAACWHYKPAMKNGKPVAVPWKAKVTWHLGGA